MTRERPPADLRLGEADSERGGLFEEGEDSDFALERRAEEADLGARRDGEEEAALL
jgi:hypothetical protein